MRLMLCRIVIAIVSSIDLTTLDSLARTSMHIHNGLIQYRSTLIAATLRCINEEVPIDEDETIRYRARANVDDGRNYGGKGGTCARDLVGECRRCGEVVCRVSVHQTRFEVSRTLADICCIELRHQASCPCGSEGEAQETLHG